MRDDVHSTLFEYISYIMKKLSSREREELDTTFPYLVSLSFSVLPSN